jgi:3-phosphoshikimate 1-carboxyvinyltransferase
VSALRVPGDKSIAHRALLLAMLAEGTSVLRGVPNGLDVRATAGAIAALGAEVQDDGAGTLTVRGTGGRLVAPAGAVDCMNSGTTMRLLAGVLATRPLTVTLDGDASLRKRPMRRVTDPLARFGATITTAAGGTAPLMIHGAGDAPAADVTVAIPSAQVKSALLFAALGAHGRSHIDGALATRDHTERLFAAFGVPLLEVDGALVVDGPAVPRAADFSVPGDISSAAFLFAAAAAAPGASVVVDDVGLNPTRIAFLEVLRRFGADVQTEITHDDAEPRGRVTVRGAELHAITIMPHEVPALIDELPLVGVLGAFAHGLTTVHGAAELRVKESDRIEAFADAARAMGAEVETAPDGFAVRGPARMRPASVVTRGDHRIAMAFAVAARVAGVTIALDDPGCVAVSFPGFAGALERVA